MKQKRPQTWRKRDAIRLCPALVLLIAFVLWQNNDLTVTQYTAHTKKETPAGGLKIVQVSDLHNKAFGKKNENLLAQIRAQNPDFILLTGDTVDSRRTDIEIALDFAAAATEIAPVYFVSGNHENRLPIDRKTAFYTGLRLNGVQLLNDETKTVSVRGCEIVLVGLDDAHLADGTLQTLCAGTCKLRGGGCGFRLFGAHPRRTGALAVCRRACRTRPRVVSAVRCGGIYRTEYGFVYQSGFREQPVPRAGVQPPRTRLRNRCNGGITKCFLQILPF